MQMPKWGLVATIRAPTEEILEFAAHHIELGAHRLFIYLDDDNRAAYDALKAHPKCRPTLTDAQYWRSLGIKRRVKHQSRQFENARHAYARAGDVDWLTHIDVDELLWPARDLAAQLADLPPECLCARMRPLEALAPDGGAGPVTHFKACAPDRPTRRRQTREVYGDFGAILNGGFLSHVAGKMIYRTGIEGLRVQIHNVFQGERMNPGERPLEETELLHLHAPGWDRFQSALAYRLEKGSYRAELKPGAPREEGGMTMHELLTHLIDEGGTEMLARFYQEVCTATPALRARLAQHGLLRSYALDLARKRAGQFPNAP
ncbi:MAG: glycosyltransferase family 2 protein [Sediminimonas sp.]|uniref:glycosyltransferase family 2 protein n=1 Tax=Sediminimonas sp. TaxID=2823379 RepID=UPI0028701961|nr:glycosyltransferase family 2 protein [Sediminimonas sp.]MDR9484404.1 glycosyltransferase family 2 protein [Sediminimonas sp.]